MNDATLIHSLAVPIVSACVYRSKPKPRFSLNAQHMLANSIDTPSRRTRTLTRKNVREQQFPAKTQSSKCLSRGNTAAPRINRQSVSSVGSLELAPGRL